MLPFAISKSNVCIQDMRDFIEPYFIQTEYNYIEGASYDEVKICCEEGQYLSIFEALDQAVVIAAEREAYGFFYKIDKEGNHLVGIFNLKEDMNGDWISHDDCGGAIGFQNDFNASVESLQNNNNAGSLIDS